MPRPLRRDAYGRPLPELTDAREAVTLQHPRNEARIRCLQALVEDTLRAVLRRGWYGDVLIRFTVEDGMVLSDMHAGLDRLWRMPQE